MKPRRLYKLIDSAFTAVWAIREDALAPIVELCGRLAVGETITQDEAYGFLGIDAPAPLSDQAGHIAVLNISGTIHPRRDPLMSLFGGVSCEEIGNAFDAALNSSAVGAILLNINSPGGTVPGVRELGQKIYEARGTKPIVALANPQMDSAALWLGTSADEVYALPSAHVGSLGAMNIHRDMSRMFTQGGLDHTIIRSAPFKGEGNPFEPLSDEAKAHLQSRIETIHRQFAADVARNRGVSLEHAESRFGQGRSLSGTDAEAVDLVDGLMTFEDVVAHLSQQINSSSNNRPPARPGIRTESFSMKPQVRLALIQAGLATITSSADDLTAALNLFFEAKGQTVPDDPEAIVKALRPTLEAATIGLLAPTAPAPGTPAAPAAPTAPVATAPSGDTLDTRTILSLVATAGASLAADQRLELQSELVAETGLTLQSAMDRISQRVNTGHEGPAGQPVTVTADARDKFEAAARDAILCRTWGQDRPEQIFDYTSGENVDWKPVGASRQFGLQSLAAMVQQCLIVCGAAPQQVLNLSKYHLAQLAMGGPRAARQLGMRELASSDGPAFNLSGMFSNILLDAQNVLLRRSYDDTRQITFQQWMRQGESLVDFKPVHKVIAGELGDPKAIPEDGKFEETTLSDGKESYKLTVWGEVFSHSWQLIVNDRLGSFTEIPVKLGRAMRRKQNRLAYGVVRDNATLASGTALFDDSTHNNLTTGALTTVTDYVGAWNTMHTKMRTQTGLDADSGVLNLSPQFVLFPPALHGIIHQALGSASSHSDNSGIVNIWQQGLTPVEDAELSLAAGGSDVAHYHAANNSDVDTVEYAYLQGLESPVIEQEMAFDRLAMRQRIYLAFAVKALDFRGLQKHTGAG